MAPWPPLTEATASIVGSAWARAFSVSSWGDVVGGERLPHRGVRLGCAAHVLVDRRAGHRQHDRHQQVLRRDVVAADKLVERDAFGDEVVVGGDLLRGGQVEAGLGLARVGDGRGADFEVPLGRGELLGDGGLVGARRRQRVLRAEHVEIGLAHAQHQVLLGGVERGLRRFERALRLRDGDAVAPVEERLRCR